MRPYLGWTLYELQAEKAKIEAEIQRRASFLGIEVVVDSTLPSGVFEVVSGPHRIRCTASFGDSSHG